MTTNEKFKKLRERFGISVEMIAHQLCVPVETLEQDGLNFWQYNAVIEMNRGKMNDFWLRYITDEEQEDYELYLEKQQISKLMDAGKTQSAMPLMKDFENKVIQKYGSVEKIPLIHQFIELFKIETDNTLSDYEAIERYKKAMLITKPDLDFDNFFGQ